MINYLSTESLRTHLKRCCLLYNYQIRVVSIISFNSKKSQTKIWNSPFHIFSLQPLGFILFVKCIVLCRSKCVPVSAKLY